MSPSQLLASAQGTHPRRFMPAESDRSLKTGQYPTIHLDSKSPCWTTDFPELNQCVIGNLLVEGKMRSAEPDCGGGIWTGESATVDFWVFVDCFGLAASFGSRRGVGFLNRRGVGFVKRPRAKATFCLPHISPAKARGFYRSALCTDCHVSFVDPFDLPLARSGRAIEHFGQLRACVGQLACKKEPQILRLRSG